MLHLNQHTGNPNYYGSQNHPTQSTAQPVAQSSAASQPAAEINQAVQAATQNQPASQSKEITQATLCRLGQETVQELLSRAQEAFQILRLFQPPEGKLNYAGPDRKPKFVEALKLIKVHFKRLRVIYEKIEEEFPSSRAFDYQAEVLDRAMSGKLFLDHKKKTELYQAALEENQEVAELVVIRNKQLKESIDQLRRIVWDCNTMLTMRQD